MSKKLDDSHVNQVLNKPIEDIIGSWKAELDKQLQVFTNQSEKLKDFEMTFQKNFETVASLGELITSLNNDCETTKSSLVDILKEEDIMIEQLTIMENSLDQLLAVADKSTSGGYYNSNESIYTAANEISKTVESVQKDIDEIDSRIIQTTKSGEENLKTLAYESTKSRDKIILDVIIYLTFRKVT
jgi:methyl-accepting chemotaxis protein